MPFAPTNDIALLKEVIALNPFKDKGKKSAQTYTWMWMRDGAEVSSSFGAIKKQDAASLKRKIIFFHLRMAYIR